MYLSRRRGHLQLLGDCAFGLPQVLECFRKLICLAGEVLLVR
jgi:hypothetical protein